MNKSVKKCAEAARRRSQTTLAAFAACAALGVGGVRADTLEYQGGAAGTYATAANFFDLNTGTTAATAPGAADNVIFNYTMSGSQVETITLATGAAANSFEINNTSTTAFTGGSLTLGGGGVTLDSGAGAVSLGEAVIVGAAQTWTNNSASTLTIASTITGAASVGTLTAPEVLTLSGGTYLQTAGGFSNGTGGVLALTIGGGANFTNNKGSTASYTGGTNILSGNTSVKSAGGYGTGAITLGDTTAATNATVSIIAGGTTTNNLVTQGAGVDTFNMGASSSTLILSGTIALNNTTSALSLTTTANTNNNPVLTLGNVVSGAGGLAVNQSVGSNVKSLLVNFNAANTYAGGTTLNTGTADINNGGTATSSAIGTGTLTIGGVTIDNTSGTAVTLATNNAVTVNGNFSFTGTNNLNLGTGAVSLGTTAGTTRTITTSTATGTLTLGGVISNGMTAVGLVKAGAGSLALTGANLYTGATTVNAGTLLVNNTNAFSTASSATGTGNVTVAGSGTTVAGIGTISGFLSLGASTTLSPGALAAAGNVGTLTVGSLTLNGTTALPYDLGTASDLISVRGALTLAGQLTVTGGTGFGAGTYDLINYTGLLTNNTLTVSSLPAGYTGSIDVNSMPGEVLLDVTAVPEPSAWATVGLGALLLGSVLRARRGAARLHAAARRLV